MNDRTKEAVYIALSGLVCYEVAKHLKLDTNAALIIGALIGKVLTIKT